MNIAIKIAINFINTIYRLLINFKNKFYFYKKTQTKFLDIKILPKTKSNKNSIPKIKSQELCQSIKKRVHLVLLPALMMENQRPIINRQFQDNTSFNSKLFNHNSMLLTNLESCNLESCNQAWSKPLKCRP